MRRFSYKYFSLCLFCAERIGDNSGFGLHRASDPDFYEDDDFINIWGPGKGQCIYQRVYAAATISSPTSGIFPFFIDKTLPNGRQQAWNNYGWGHVQIEVYTDRP